MFPKYFSAVLVSALVISPVHAQESNAGVYPARDQAPLSVGKEDYQPSNLSLQGLNGLYINLDELISGAKPKNIKLPAELKAQVISRLEKAGMRLLSKADMEKALGQPEMSMFPSYPKHLGSFKAGDPRVEYNAQCCTAGIWTSFAQGINTLRHPLLNQKLATWGEGHNTTDCADIGKWLGQVVLKTVDDFIVAKQKAEQDYTTWLGKQKAVDVKQAVTKPELAKPAEKVATQAVAKPDTPKVIPNKTVEVHATEDAPNLACDTAILLYTELFPTATATLNRTNIAILAKVADNIKACPQYRYRIETHADQRADDEYNEILSARRAIAIRNYLVDHGVDENQFELRFYGERKPLLTGNDEAAWSVNRRVVVLPIR